MSLVTRAKDNSRARICEAGNITSPNYYVLIRTNESIIITLNRYIISETKTLLRASRPSPSRQQSDRVVLAVSPASSRQELRSDTAQVTSVAAPPSSATTLAGNRRPGLRDERPRATTHCAVTTFLLAAVLLLRLRPPATRRFSLVLRPIVHLPSVSTSSTTAGRPLPAAHRPPLLSTNCTRPAHARHPPPPTLPICSCAPIILVRLPSRSHEPRLNVSLNLPRNQLPATPVLIIIRSLQWRVRPLPRIQPRGRKHNSPPQRNNWRLVLGCAHCCVVHIHCPIQESAAVKDLRTSFPHSI
jgi:hypothetical protein